MLTLGLDTATDVCAVAVLEGDLVLAEATLHLSRSHGRRLAPLVEELFAHISRPVSDLEVVAVSGGPGSYTGLRIGMSTAKGLALSTGAAFVAVPTLQALTFGLEGTVAVVLPSRRGEVYAAVYRDGLEVEAPAALEVRSFADWLPTDLDAIGGAGAERIADVRLEVGRVSLIASGVSVARLGQRVLEADGARDWPSTEPVYLKPVAVSQPRGIFAL